MTRTARRSTNRPVPRKASVRRVSQVPVKRVVKRSRIAKKSGTMPPLFRTLLIVLFAVFFVSCVAVVVWFFVFPSLLLSGITQKNTVYVSQTLDSEDNIILFAQFNKDLQTSKVFAVDGTMEIVVPNGYGTYALESLYPLLKMDAWEDATLKSIMGRALTVPVDELLVGEPILAANFTKKAAQKSLLTAIKGTSPFAIDQYVSLLRLYFLVSSRDEISFFTTDEGAKFAEEVTLVLGEGEEMCSVAIVNTTATPKLAAKIVELFEKNGIYVIREDSTMGELAHTSIQEKAGFSAACASLSTKLQAFFPSTTTTATQNKDTTRYRADIVILLGADIVEAK